MAVESGCKAAAIEIPNHVVGKGTQSIGSRAPIPTQHSSSENRTDVQSGDDFGVSVTISLAMMLDRQRLPLPLSLLPARIGKVPPNTSNYLKTLSGLC